jgi:dTDP-4-dehydrorhamnose 3,5-epimerase
MLRFEPTPFYGLIQVLENEYMDPRGSFAKVYEDKLFNPYIGHFDARQVNLSKNNVSGTVRGFHFQVGPQSEFKIVKCLKGSIYDVLLDTRKDSETYGECLSFVLSENAPCSLIIPPGVAHAFQTLEDNSYVLYVHTASYSPENSMGFNALDANLNFTWPLPTSIISAQDIALPMFRKEQL